uniref:DUF3453 domain-containing protein n=1 Tax=Heterorhabditis bacteriophora TaxID=37862 RepID=A0A1I7W8S9_HETBA
MSFTDCLKYAEDVKTTDMVVFPCCVLLLVVDNYCVQLRNWVTDPLFHFLPKIRDIIYHNCLYNQEQRTKAANLLFSVFSTRSQLRFTLPEVVEDSTKSSSQNSEEDLRGIYHYSDSDQTLKSRFKIPDFEEALDTFHRVKFGSSLLRSSANVDDPSTSIAKLLMPSLNDALNKMEEKTRVYDKSPKITEESEEISESVSQSTELLQAASHPFSGVRLPYNTQNSSLTFVGDGLSTPKLYGHLCDVGKLYSNLLAFILIETKQLIYGGSYKDESSSSFTNIITKSRDDLSTCIVKCDRERPIVFTLEGPADLHVNSTHISQPEGYASE